MLIHLGNCALLGYLVFQLTRSRELAGLAGFFFLLHCGHFRAIYWIAAIGVLLGAFFALCSVIFLLNVLNEERKVCNTVLSTLSFLLAMSAYPGIVPALAVHIACILIKRPMRSSWIFILPHVAGVGGLTLLIRFLFSDQVFVFGDPNFQLGSNILLGFFWVFFLLFGNAHILLIDLNQPAAYEWVAGVIFVLLLLSSLRRCSAPVYLWCVWAVATSLVFLPYAPNFAPFGMPSGETDAILFSRYIYTTSLGTSALLAHACLYAWERSRPSWRPILPFLLIFPLASSIYWLHRLEGVQYFHQSTYCHSQKDLEGAVDLARRSIDHYPDFSPSVYLTLFKATSSSSEFDFIKQALYYFPQHAHAHCAVGVLYSKADQQAKAEFHLQRALELSREDIRIHDEVGSFYAARENWDSAANVYEKGLGIKPENVRMLFKFFEACFRANRQGDGLLALGRLFELEPEHFLAWSDVGLNNAHAGHYDKALLAYTRALSAYQRYMEANRHFGSNVRYYGDVIPPDILPKLHYQCGAMLEHLGQGDRAQQHYGQAHEAASELPEDHPINVTLDKRLAGFAEP